jgi:uncharacterized protein (DUF1501 family)
VFTISDRGQGCGRRDFLRIGALGLGGLSLPWLLGARARAAASGQTLTEKSVIFLFLHGGPSQIETFDPKMSAPAEVRSATGETATALPGVTFGASFPRLARLADRLAVVRSYRPGDANHDIKPVVHRDFLNANLGSIYARVAGTTHPVTGLPTNAALVPRSVDPATQAATLNFGNFFSPGAVGGAYAPFVPGGSGQLLDDLRLHVPRERLDDRRLLLSRFDGLRRQLDASGAMEAADRLQRQALDVVLRGAAAAFDLSKEDPRLVARYDTAPLVRPETIRKKWNNHKHYADNARALGKLLLLARRLCEAGCGFVTVTTNFVWDMHADVNNAPMVEGMSYMGPPLDHALSAFVEDVEARGLADRILLVACGEMGRTPRLNKGGGRDHWGNLGPLLFCGGGLKMGQVVGRSTKNAGDPASEPVTMHHLVATLMHTLFDVGAVRLMRGVPDDVARVITGGEPIRELVG